MSPKKVRKSKKPRRRPGRPPSPNPKDRKVTARFSDEEYEMLRRVGRERGEKLSSLVRKLVVGTIDEVKARK